MIRIPWDIEEVVALVDICDRSENGQLGNQTLSDALMEISKVLVHRADILGIEHDEKYRNYSGMRKQYYYRILVAFTDGKKGAPSGEPRQIDYEVVEMYKNNRAEFDRILRDFNSKYR